MLLVLLFACLACSLNEIQLLLVNHSEFQLRKREKLAAYSYRHALVIFLVVVSTMAYTFPQGKWKWLKLHRGQGTNHMKVLYQMEDLMNIRLNEGQWGHFWMFDLCRCRYLGSGFRILGYQKMFHMNVYGKVQKPCV